MKIQRKWKAGGRPRRKNTTKKWLLRQELIEEKDKRQFLKEPPLVVPKCRKKGA